MSILKAQSFINRANTCLDDVCRTTSRASGLLSTGKAWRTVNKMQLEVPLQASNVTLHTG